MTAESWRYTICDVFTEQPLAGNQLAVFPDATGIPAPLLQPLAREINFSETVYVYPPAGDGTARVRIFTPVAELPFAGHPVLGTAVVLVAAGAPPAVALETGAGVIQVSIDEQAGRARFGWMQQPVPTVRAVTEPAPLLAALGVPGARLPVERYDNGPTHIYVGLEDEAAVAAVTPDLAALARIARGTDDGFVTVSCFAGGGRQWTTRVFAPVEGFEDPATGSAAGPLVCHLGRHGAVPFGTEIEIRQGEAVGRPSTLYARAEGTRDRIEGVAVGGAAVIVGEGAFDGAVLREAATLGGCSPRPESRGCMRDSAAGAARGL